MGEGLGATADQVGEIECDVLQLEGRAFDTGEIENIVDHLEQVFGGLGGQRRVFHLLIGHLRGFEQLQHCFSNQSQLDRNPANKELLLARQCRFASRMIPLLPGAAALWAQVQQPDRTVLENVAALTSLIFHEFSYDPEFSSVVTPVSEVLLHRRGVCQDFAQLAISCLRAVGIPARYVSGYLETQPPEGFERLVGADASHAWFAVYDPQLGWVDFDPTNNLLPDERHLTLAYGRDYADVVPLKGVLPGLGEHLLEVAVDVMPL